MQVEMDGEADVRRFEFTGSGGEYFRIWIVNVLLSILTLYMYSAWAKVRTKRYFHGNTRLDGAAFEYHARPLQILAGRVVAVLLLALVVVGGMVYPLVPSIAATVLVLALPWILWRSTAFNAGMTGYRNVRFGFDGGLGRMYLYTLVLPFLPIIAALVIGIALSGPAGVDESTGGAIAALGVVVFYALSPAVHRMLAQYLAGNHVWGGAAFDATLSTGRFYAIYVKSIGVAVAAVLAVIALAVVLGGLVSASVFAIGVAADGAASGPDASPESLPGTASVGALVGGVVLAYPLVLLAGYLVTAYFRARLRHHLYAGVLVESHVRLESSVRTWPLWRLMIGNLLLLVCTLGLAWPWVAVRRARFFARHTRVRASKGIDDVVERERARRGVLGEEIGEAFDVGLDVGF